MIIRANGRLVEHLQPQYYRYYNINPIPIRGQILPSYVLMHLQFFRPSSGPAISPRLLFMLQLIFLKHPINLGCNCMNRKKNVMSAHFEITKKEQKLLKFPYVQTTSLFTLFFVWDEILLRYTQMHFEKVLSGHNFNDMARFFQ